MNRSPPPDTPSRLQASVVAAIRQVMGPAAPRGQVRPEDRLGADLALSSLAVVRLAGLLQKTLDRGPLPFHTLFVKPDGSVLHDIRVSDLVDFIDRCAAKAP